jgi:hypothetical protein
MRTGYMYPVQGPLAAQTPQPLYSVIVRGAARRVVR